MAPWVLLIFLLCCPHGGRSANPVSTPRTGQGYMIRAVGRDAACSLECELGLVLAARVQFCDGHPAP